jgi:transcriptional regulator with XRE-family HTH domain
MIFPMNKKNISSEPGMRIRLLREQLGLTRKQFETITGFKANTLRHLETGSQLLQATTARMLSNFFIHLFGLGPEKASEDFLLHGKEENDPVKE